MAKNFLPRGPAVPDIATRGAGTLPLPPTAKPLEKQAQVPPYWLYKPPEGVDFYYNVRGTVAAGAGSQLILSATPPLILTPNYEGVVAGVTIFVDAPNLTTDVIWTLRFREAPVPGWDRLTTFPRVANNLSITFPGVVQVQPGTKIDVLVTNNSAFAWDVGVEVAGWSWPRMSRQRVFGRDGT